MSDISQMHFEFKDFEKCFSTWRKNLPIYGDSMQLVISTIPYTSGYWIEPLGTDVQDGDVVYTGEQVDDLERRVKEEVAKAPLSNRSPRLIK